MAPQPQQQPPDKIVLVLIDGVGDVTIPAFGDQTPLQVAHTPNMDCIAGVSVHIYAPCQLHSMQCTSTGLGTLSPSGLLYHVN
jgi:hypothetical protein